ncbi:C40 family peptidase [Streptomyces calidiresistens]|uniref:Glycoside hydrolase n=1 Tax=Streptomyces calidiresistens TaxID=1485586 RepID=A0A7W3SZL1_9ACTN|nr:C40 family peptidase [Streptomyces calidiresistens]MBB0228122.1 glycoside hydrolase [Streptomyces calidiresistens]
MSSIRTTGRHRKPRRSRAAGLLRGGVLTGVLGTVAVTSPSASATERPAENPAETTGEFPALGTVITSTSSRASEATEDYVARTHLREARELATVRAQRAAERQRAADEAAAAEAAEAEARRAAEAEEAEARRAAEAEERRAAEAEAAAASRAAERTDLGTASAPASADDAATAQSTPVAAPASGGGNAAVVAFARAQVGKAYSMGATGPNAWDCSGLTGAAYAAAGISLPRTSQAQSAMGTHIPVSQARPGDLLYWGGAGSAYHVAIYVGDGRFVGAQNPSTGVVEQDLSWSQPSGAIRIG